MNADDIIARGIALVHNHTRHDPSVLIEETTP